jgi:lipoprotein-anchoring transpeptidase ErfK/SrfK
MSKTPSPASRVVAALATLVTLLALLALAIAHVPAAAAADVAGSSAAGDPWPGPSASSAWLADVVYPTVGRIAPSSHARVAVRVPSVSAWGGPEQLLVLGSHVDPGGTEWVRVRLDVRPNGEAVWLDTNYVTLRETHWRVTVSRAQRRLRVYWNGRLRRAWRVVVGKPSTPSPAGLFAIAAELRQPDPGDFVGSWVLPLTAHSNVLMHFEGGDGQIALHGRGGASLADPLGSARSHGCIRMDNAMIAWLAGHVPVGTPVLVS